MKRAPWLLVTLILVVGVSSLPASADTFFSNFGQNNDYNCCVGGTIGGQNSPVGWIIQANEFTAAISGNVSQIDVAVGFVTGTNGATVSLWTDSAGIPTAMLGSWDLTNLPNFGSCCAVGTITGISGINLAAGTNYFLMVSAPDPTWDAWNYNSTGDVGLVDYTFDGGRTWNQAPGSTRYAFDVLGGGGGGGVPEPASLIMFGSGLLAAAGTIRRRFQR